MRFGLYSSFMDWYLDLDGVEWKWLEDRARVESLSFGERPDGLYELVSNVSFCLSKYKINKTHMSHTQVLSANPIGIRQV